MKPDEWDRLAAWHNAWLAADPADRRRLRADLDAMPPDLAALAHELTSEDAPGGFLETPALVLTAARLAREATLAPGAEIGPYRIVEVIGSGGMGVVYRAADVRLGREVALKMLVPIGAPDAAQIDRFMQEARLTASIDHPNVVKVYDVGLFGDQPYMVIELLEGEPLRARLDRGALSVSETRRILTDIARGLVAAHARGLIHRDLKPENIVLGRSGRTTILDFGIAKLTPDAVQGRAGASTLTGILLGTPGYVSPEQVRGGSVDARTDLFALGSMAFEMLAGHRLFAGESTVDTLHAILRKPAPDLRQLHPEVPPGLAGIAARLLEKAPDDRFQSATDLVWALEQLDRGPHAPVVPARGQPGPAAGRFHLAWVVAPLVALAVAGGWWLGRRPLALAGPPEAVRFSWTLPAGTTLSSGPVVSPDGRRIAWTATDASSRSRLFVRSLSSREALAIAGTDGAQHPFWSPDGASVGFFAQGQLKKIAVDGGAPVSLAPAPDARGGAWGRSGVIVFQPVYRDSPLMRVPEQGGSVEPATVLDRDQDEVSHRWPAFLPDGRHFLYVIVSLRESRRGVYIGSVDGAPVPPEQPTLATESGAFFTPVNGHGGGLLLSVADGRVEARGFDPERRRLTDDGVALDIAAVPASPHHAALLTASAGVLASVPAPIPWGARFASVHRDGTGLELEPEPMLGGFPRVSPDGTRVARVVVDTRAGNPDIWVDDLERGTRLRLTTTQDFDLMPVWSPDGTEIAYRSGLVDEPILRIVDASGGATTRDLPCPESACEPTDWSPDGGRLVVNVRGTEVWSVPLDPAGHPAPLVAESYRVRDARISPDGRWICYVSEESGAPQVSIRSLTGSPQRVVVSSAGGDQPVWRRDGRELFFADHAGVLHSVAVRVAPDGRLAVGPPRRLNVPPLGERHWGTIYDVSADGGRIYFPHANPERPPAEFEVVTGWLALAGR